MSRDGSAPGPPPIVFGGRRRAAREIRAMAAAWHQALGEEVFASADPVALVMVNRPEAVALLFALSSGRAPLIVLAPDPRGWSTSPPIPPGTWLVLPPTAQHLAREGERLGLRVMAPPEPESQARQTPLAFMALPGFVFFTSGSTGMPKPVYRTTAGVLRAVSALGSAARFPAQGGVIASLPLDRPLGIHHGLLLAAVLGRPLGLIERFHHHAVLALFASGEYHYWAATPAMVDILGRCPLAGPHAAPPRCMINGRLSSAIARAFEARFGVRPRPVYGLTEQGPVALDDGPDSAVRPDTAGRPLPGIGLRVGDDPRAPLPPGQVGRVWISNPWRMEGYGYPPSLERPESVDGWWASPDLGWLDEAGYLTLAGRTDDCLRMGTGHLVNPATVAACAESHPGVREAAVVALDTAGERVLAVLVESVETLRRTDLRAHLARSLPAWCQPRIVETVPALPRLSTGRADRRACVEILRKAQAREGP